MPDHMKPSGYFPFQFYFTKCELSDTIIATAYMQNICIRMSDPAEETDGHERQTELSRKTQTVLKGLHIF